MSNVMLGIAVAGIVMLVMLAWIIGKIEAHARASAWKRIATARRTLWFRKQQLAECLYEPMCDGCPVRRYLRDQNGD